MHTKHFVVSPRKRHGVVRDLVGLVGLVGLGVGTRRPREDHSSFYSIFSNDLFNKDT